MKPRQFLIRNSERGIRNYGVLLRWNILMMGRLSGLPIFILTNYNLALHGNYCVSNWFSLPFAYKRKRECEVSPHVGEVARSARGAGLAQHITACYKHDVMFCAELTTEQSHHYSARWCAVIRLKSIKVVWGKTRVFPHMRHITSVELSSQTVQWTVWEKGA